MTAPDEPEATPTDEADAPSVDAELVKDLDVDASDPDRLRGGNSATHFA